MNQRKSLYPFAISLMAFIALTMVALAQIERVFPEFRNLFILLRAYYSVSTLCFVIYFWKFEFDDFSGALFTANLVIYTAVMMWFMPLYEISYVQVALGSALFRFRRTWLHSLLLGAGLFGMVVTYWAQERMQWVLPTQEKADWIFALGILFAVTICIQKFAMAAFRRDADNLRRFGVIGRDAARLTHDLKGLLTSPLLILETLKDKSLNLPPEFYDRQLHRLIQDMEHVGDTVRGINRLAVVNVHMEPVEVKKTILGVLKILERRMSGIEISLPEEKTVLASSEHLHSVFFNLFINSIQAFERNAIADRKIKMSWLENKLHLEDNAGGLKSQKIKSDASTGLGLEIIHSDVHAMKAKFNISSTGDATKAVIEFAKRI